MKTRAVVLCSMAVLWGVAGVSSAQAPKTAAGVEGRLPTYLNQFLSYDPASKVTVEKAPEKRLAGFQGYKIKRTGKYPKLAVEKTVEVSDDGKWFFDGEIMVNPNAAAGQGAPDLAWIEAKISALYRSPVKVMLTPERDAAGLKGVAIAVESGFGPVRLPGYVTADGAKFLGGTLWDFQMDPREERRKRIDLSVPRFQGRPDGAVTIVEYADMECGYCRYRGGQMDSLLEANAKTLSYKRYYKFFPLWFNHAWAMKAASAADCLFRYAGQAMFAFKKQVYAEQATLTVTAIDELAVNAAEAAGVSRADFLACYLREQSLADVRKDIEEGQRLGVKSTPTYFVDGTEIVWVEDLVMEDYLRTKAPGLKTIDYGPHS
jgi:protein-disulfide isomerase